MSIVAYKNGTMAADRRSTNQFGGIELFDVRKVATDSNGVVYGVVGLTTKIQAIIKAIDHQRETGGSVIIPMPEADGNESDCQILIAYPNSERLLYLHWLSGRVVELDVSQAPYCAMGSGSHYALGAMHSGASAFAAVQAAIDHDMHCGGSKDMARIY